MDLRDLRGFGDGRERFRWAIPQQFNIGVDIADRWAAVDPSRPAVIDGSGVTTFADLRDASNRLANGLRALGIERGDRVALMLPQGAPVAVVHAAIYKLGAIAVPLASLFGVDALLFRLRHAGCRAVLTNATGAAKIAAIRAELPALETVISSDGAEADVLALQALLARSSPGFEAVDTAADDPALMIYTSGTTGPPKGALHAHRVLLGHLPGFVLSHDGFPLPGDRLWTPADWAWAGGLLNALLPSLHFGVPIVAQPEGRFDPEAAFAFLAAAKIRNAFIPPTALRLMRGVPRPAGLPRLHLRSVTAAGEPLGAETFAWGRKALGVPVNEVFGQTECNYVLASGSGTARPGRIGRAVPGHEAAVIRPDGSLCPPGEVGEIAVRRPDPAMFLGYWRDPEATAAKFRGDWMLTGDLARADDEGYVTFVGRDDDVITSAGYRIGPAEIEDCLLKHPAVAAAAVVGRPDPIRTEVVKSVLVLREGFAPSPALEDEIRAFVRTRLSAHEYPREIAFVPALPMTTSGKVMRRVLRDAG